jgi:hypothetical protein
VTTSAHPGAHHGARRRFAVGTQAPATIGRRAVAGVAATSLALAPVTAVAQAQTCPQTSPPTTWVDTTLDTGTSRSGVAFNVATRNLQLSRSAGIFTEAPVGIAEDSVFIAGGDFDRDGWDDFVGSSDVSGWLRVFRNQTMNSPPPNWNVTSAYRTPDFRVARELKSADAVARRRPVAAGDFNGDGWDDVLRAVAIVDEHPYEAKIWLNARANDIFSYATFQADYDAMAPGSYPANMGEMLGNASNIVVLDYNGDRKLDFLVGSSADGGTVRIFLNDCALQNPLPSPLPAADLPLPCANNPRFQYAGALISNLGTGTGAGAIPSLAYADFDRDGWRDLVVGAPNCCTTASQRLRVWKGVDGGGIEATSSQSITFAGGASTLIAADFSMDGLPDLLVGTGDQFGVNQGGRSWLYTNNGTATPFTAAGAAVTSYNAPSRVFYGGIALDFDHDPDGTPDVLFADGAQSNLSQFYVMSNRMAAGYGTCGEAVSNVIPLGALADDEMVVTGARIRASTVKNNGTVTWFLSNETPANWVQATDCGDGTGDFCAGFPRATGRDVRWKASLCSSTDQSQTPTVASAEVRFDYTTAREHYRAGVVTVDGVAYVGAFRQPGDRGHFYAISAALDRTYWDVADKLDALSDGGPSQRRIFTADASGRDLVKFDPDGNPDLLAVLGTANVAQANTVVNWVRGKRFGTGNPDIPLSRLGAVESSTPAVVGAPGLPSWYAFAAPEDRARAETFVIDNSDRETIVLFGAKDGMVHAIRNDSTNITDSSNGTEVWAFIPPKVASTLVADQTYSLGGTLRISAYPDGSPTVTDWKRPDGTIGTAAIVAGGNGGQSLVALDITNATALNSSPDPLWTATPGDSAAGQGLSKPAVARVRIGGVERTLVIAGTGTALDDPSWPYDKGRVVSAYDLSTGELMWKFRAQCPVTSDITVFETDDNGEPGTPTLDGYHDRAVFADRCGYVYKLNPARDLNGAWNGNAGYGSIAVDPTDGVSMYAVFATESTSNALGSQSPIAGTIAARTDESTRMLLFFGTGGLESHPVTERNEFYAVYADTGAVRRKSQGSCVNGVCEKYYGGVVVTPEQVITTRTLDPQIATAACDPGRTVVQSLQLDSGPTGDFLDDFAIVINSAVMGALYGDAGAVYFATLAGDVKRIGTPRAAQAGDDSASAGGPPIFGTPEAGAPGPLGFTEPVTFMGWRQVL